MTNPTALTHTTTPSRLTVQDIFRYVAKTHGHELEDFSENEENILYDLINAELIEWRVLTKTRVYGEQKITWTWAGSETYDPASGDTKVEVPEDFAELIEPWGYQLTSDGLPKDKVWLLEETDFLSAFKDGVSRWTDSDVSVMRMFQESTNRRRLLEFYPAPSDDTAITLAYYALAEKVTSASDTIEAPVALNDGIRYGVAARWAELDGDDQAAQRFNMKKAEKLSIFTAPSSKEKASKSRAKFMSDWMDTPATNGPLGW